MGMERDAVDRTFNMRKTKGETEGATGWITDPKDAFRGDQLGLAVCPSQFGCVYMNKLRRSLPQCRRKKEKKAFCRLLVFFFFSLSSSSSHLVVVALVFSSSPSWSSSSLPEGHPKIPLTD